MAVEILRALGPLGVERVLVHRWGGPLESEMNAVADRALYEPLRRARVVLRRQHRTRRLAVPVEYAAAWLVLRWVRPALVWGNTVLAAPYVWAAARLRVPMVLHAHESEPTLSQVLGRYGIDWSTHPAHIVACSLSCAAQVAIRTGRPPQSITVVTSRPDLDAVRQLAGCPVMLGPGFHLVVCAVASRGKGVEVLARAAELVQTRRPDVLLRCTWVGRRASADLQVTPATVQFVGEQPDAERWAAAADVVALPTFADSFPLAVIEAMALGKPVIASNVGGIPEQLGDTGVLIEPGDAEALATAIIDLYDDPVRRAELGRAAAARAEVLWDVRRMHAEVRAVATGLLDVPSPCSGCTGGPALT